MPFTDYVKTLSWLSIAQSRRELMFMLIIGQSATLRPKYRHLSYYKFKLSRQRTKIDKKHKNSEKETWGPECHTVILEHMQKHSCTICPVFPRKGIVGMVYWWRLLSGRIQVSLLASITRSLSSVFSFTWYSSRIHSHDYHLLRFCLYLHKRVSAPAASSMHLVLWCIV